MQREHLLAHRLVVLAIAIAVDQAVEGCPPLRRPILGRFAGRSGGVLPSSKSIGEVDRLIDPAQVFIQRLEQKQARRGAIVDGKAGFDQRLPGLITGILVKIADHIQAERMNRRHGRAGQQRQLPAQPLPLGCADIARYRLQQFLLDLFLHLPRGCFGKRHDQNMLDVQLTGDDPLDDAFGQHRGLA